MRRLPIAVRALLINLSSLAAAVIAAIFLRDHAAIPLSLLQIAGIQGLLAAAFSYASKQPPWWLPIQLLFLPAIVAALSFEISPTIYFAAFAVLLLFYWSTHRTRVPLYLSGRQTWQRLLKQLPSKGRFHFIDLGSGIGGLPLYLARERPEGEYVGVEIAPAPWLISRLRAWWSGSRARFLRMDYAHLNLADYDVVFTFLSPAAMPGIWQKARAEMKEGALLISLAFPVPGVKPDLVVESDGPARHVLYGWRMQGCRGSFSGIAA